MTCSNDKIGVGMVEKDGWKVKEDMDEHKSKKGVWTRMGEWKRTKVARVYSDLDYNKSSMHPTFLVDMA